VCVLGTQEDFTEGNEENKGEEYPPQRHRGRRGEAGILRAGKLNLIIFLPLNASALESYVVQSLVVKMLRFLR